MKAESIDRLMKAVLAMALADGAIADDERALIRKVQARLGVGDEQLRKVIAEFRQAKSPDALLPRQSEDRHQAMLLMVVTAAIDGQIDTREQALLDKVAGRLGFDHAEFQDIFDEGVATANRLRAKKQPPTAAVETQALRAKASELVADFYHRAYEPVELREQAARLAEVGASAVIPLVRGFESYRRAVPPLKTARIKEAFADTLGEIGDPRAVYYLATYLLLGDEEEDAHDAALRAAVAESLGKLVGERFTRDAKGVNAARLWWHRKGSQHYQRLMF